MGWSARAACFAVIGLGASPAWAEDGLEAPAEAAEPTSGEATTTERGLALSVGTGPLPLNTATLGVTGLGARLLVPSKKGSWVVSGGHTSGRLSSFPEDGFADRDFTRLGGTTLMLGYRGGEPPEEAGVVAYGVGGPLAARGVTSSGDGGDKRDDLFRSGLWSVGGSIGAGVDGFLNRHLSAGVEVGGLALFALGGNRWRGEPDDQWSGIGLSTYASAQLTVWQ